MGRQHSRPAARGPQPDRERGAGGPQLDRGPRLVARPACAVRGSRPAAVALGPRLAARPRPPDRGLAAFGPRTEASGGPSAPIPDAAVEHDIIVMK